jgi:hypothetical protein
VSREFVFTTPSVPYIIFPDQENPRLIQIQRILATLKFDDGERVIKLGELSHANWETVFFCRRCSNLNGT